jgi:hypothetical protein
MKRLKSITEVPVAYPGFRIGGTVPLPFVHDFDVLSFRLMFAEDELGPKLILLG